MLGLLSDLGDETTLMVSVSRTYQEKGSSERYPVEYFAEQSTVGAWRQNRSISLDHDAWKGELEQRQRALAAAGEPFTVSRISDSIEISFVVPVNQDPPFESWNANLVGQAVTQSGNLRIVEDEIMLAEPIDDQRIGQTRFAAPLGLEVRITYSSSREVPLVPEIEPADPMAAHEAIRLLEPSEPFTVLEVRKRNGAPWYRVRTRIGEGWINSTALLGQELRVVRAG